MLRLVALLIGTITLFSCNENKEAPTKTSVKEKVEQQNNRYVNDSLNITLDNSLEWDIQENFQGIPLVMFSPMVDTNDFFQENINVFSEPVGNYTLTEYSNKSIEAIKQYLIDFKEEEAPQSIYIKGHEFKRVLYSHKAQGVDINILVYFSIRNGQGIVINCSSLDSTYEQYKPNFEKIVNSLVFLR